MRAQAQSFDRVAAAYDRLGELNRNDLIGPWLAGLLPATGRRALDLGCGGGRHAVRLAATFGQVDAVDVAGPMIELARARRPRPNITYRQGDLHDVAGPGRYDFVFSAMTLHHAPDLHAALTRIKSLVAPGGRLAVADVWESAPRSPQGKALRILERVVPLRPRLHGQAVMLLAADLGRRGPATARELYRLRTMRPWLDHRVTDRFFAREDLERSCDTLFPGYRFDILGGPRGIGLVWDAPPEAAARAEPSADARAVDTRTADTRTAAT